MRLTGPDLEIVRLNPGTFEVTETYSSVTEAANSLGCTRENIYQSIRDGDERLGSLWMRRTHYEAWSASRKSVS